MCDFSVEIERNEQFLDRFCTHSRVEFIAEFLELGVILFITEQLSNFEISQSRVDNEKRFEIQHAFDVPQRHIKQQANPRRQRLQEPDVRSWASQLDMAHALAAHLGQRYFHTAFLTNYTSVLKALVFSTQAFVVFGRPKDARTEKTITLRLKCSIVDGLRFLYFAKGPRANHLWR